MTVETPTKDKQITIEVPEDRVAEFYAFYGRFLADPRGRHGHGPGHRGHRGAPKRCHHGHGEDAGHGGDPETADG